jgi:uncharacterized protein (DUF697 family)
MHDLDQTRLELDPEVDIHGSGEVEPEDALESAPDTEDSQPVGETESGEAEFDVENEEAAGFFAGESVDEEEALAAELLGVGSDNELDQFLGKLVRGASRFARSAAGRQLGQMLRKVAKKALPMVGTAVGTYFGGPAGAALGRKLASTAAGMFEIQVEGLSPQDQEFQTARAYVRLARAAARNLDRTAPVSSAPAAARQALITAAQSHAPGLVRRKGSVRGARSGRWVRTGRRTIVLYGV